MNSSSRAARPFSKLLDPLPGAYFKEAAGAFARAVETDGVSHDVILDIAGIRFRLRCSGGVGETILPGLAHLAAREETDVSWTVNCWDDSSTGSAMTVPSPKMLVNQHRNCLHMASDQRYRAFYQAWMETLYLVDRQGEAYACYLDAEKLPMYEKAGSLRPVFNAAFNLEGKQLVHAASIGYAHGSLLLAGPARSGKSTLAVQCLLHGMGYQSDDLCVLSQEDVPRSWCLYNVAKLREDSLARVAPDFPLRSFTEGEETKHFFHVHDVFPERILPCAPVRALVIPQITGESTSRLVPASRLDAMRALIPWSVSEVPSSDNLGEKIMLKALGRLPAYTLYLGSDFKQTFELLRKLIDAP